MKAKNILEGGIASYNIVVKQMVSSTNAAVLLQHLVFWLGVTKKKGNHWLYKDWKEIQSSTGMSKSEIETAKKKLLKINVIKVKVKQVPKKINEKYKMVPVTHYQVDFVLLEKMMIGFLEKEKTVNEALLKNKKSSFPDIQEEQENSENRKPDLSEEYSNKSLLGEGLKKYSFVKKLRDVARNGQLQCIFYFEGYLIGVSKFGRLYYKKSLKDLTKNDAMQVYSQLHKIYQIKGPDFILEQKV